MYHYSDFPFPYHNNNRELSIASGVLNVCLAKKINIITMDVEIHSFILSINIWGRGKSGESREEKKKNETCMLNCTAAGNLITTVQLVAPYY